MSTTTRRVLAAAALTIGVVALSGQPGSSAEGPPETTTTLGSGFTEIELSQTDTGNASDSFQAAKSICYSKVLPKALFFTTLDKFMFPACPVAVQVCAEEALANAHAAVVHLYDHYFDCAD